MKSKSRNSASLIRAIVIQMVILSFGVGGLHGQGLILLDEIVEAHGADVVPPISVQMIGRVDRNQKTEPLKIVATREEKIRLEYGTAGKDTLVMTQGLIFQDDGEKFTYPRVYAGFSQLDMTGLFLVQQLTKRAVRVDKMSTRVVVAGVLATPIRVESERTQTHKGSVKVADSVELYVGPNGLLLGISRSFYEGRPDQYTQSFLFSDYRKTESGMSLPYQIDLYIKGQRRQSFHIETYQFDVRADRELFQSRRVNE
jgi:hypothetical protein